jgi:hypothetical protein
VASGADTLTWLGTTPITITGDSAADSITIAATAASTTAVGVLETATDAEAIAVTATDKIIVPSNLDNVFAEPPALGGTTPAAAAVTTLTVGGDITTTGTAIDWDLKVTDASALTIDDAGTPMMTFDTNANSISISTPLTIATGQALTLGVVQWDDGSDQIDGEQIADNTIDDDSIDFADVTLDDLVSAESDFISVAADDIFDFTRNDTGTVTITASDDDATAALTVLPGGVAALTLGGANTTSIAMTTDGGTVTIDGSVAFPDANASPAAVGVLLYDNTITGLDDGGLVWYDDDEIQLLTALDSSETLDSGDDAKVLTFNWNGGNGYWNLAAAGVGDIIAVGPGFSTGSAFTDGAVSTGTSAFVWEGTANDTVEFIIAFPEDPTTADETTTFAEQTGTVVLGPADFATDDALIKADLADAKDVTLTQVTGITVDDSDNMTGIGTISSGAITSTGTSGFGGITSAGTIEGAVITQGGQTMYDANDVPGGELGGTWAAPTIDDSVTVTGWVLGTSSATQITVPTLISDTIYPTGAADFDIGGASTLDVTIIENGGTYI